MKYDVEITETLQKTVSVEAVDEHDALMTVRRLYYGDKIVLYAENHVDTEFDVLEAAERSWVEDVGEENE